MRPPPFKGDGSVIPFGWPTQSHKKEALFKGVAKRRADVYNSSREEVRILLYSDNFRYNGMTLLCELFTYTDKQVENNFSFFEKNQREFLLFLK